VKETKPKRRRKKKELRKAIIKYLKTQTFPRTTGQIAREIGLNWYSINTHLFLMKAEGILFHEKVGRQNQWWTHNISQQRHMIQELQKIVEKLNKENEQLRNEIKGFKGD